LQPKAFHSIDEIDRAITKLRRRLSDVEGLRTAGVSHDDARASNVESAISKAILEIYGEHSPEFREHGYYHFVTSWRINGSDQEYQASFVDGLATAETTIGGLIQSLAEARADLQASAPRAHEAQASAAKSNEVFVVHGHDHETLTAVEAFLSVIGLQPIVLHKQANEGRTLIEKFERHASRTPFAVVLVTHDDWGCSNEEKERVQLAGKIAAVLKPRARQNVILELGYFAGSLGRNRVAVLYERGVELPSDLMGIVYVQLDSGWKTALARELRAAGVAFDANRLLDA
jgi:predicted nucleotide-binding protein